MHRLRHPSSSVKEAAAPGKLPENFKIHERSSSPGTCASTTFRIGVAICYRGLESPDKLGTSKSVGSTNADPIDTTLAPASLS